LCGSVSLGNSKALLHPRFFSGLILFGAFVLPENPVGFGVGGIFKSFAVLVAANNFEFSNSFAAALALLLNFFFSFAIDIYSLLSF
jgi:hypothetical protein